MHLAVIPGRREILGLLVRSSNGHGRRGLVDRVDWVGVGIHGAAVIRGRSLAFGLHIRERLMRDESGPATSCRMFATLLPDPCLDPFMRPCMGGQVGSGRRGLTALSLLNMPPVVTNDS